MSATHKAELDRHFAWFEARLPPRPAKFVGWLRKPSSRLVRIPMAILLIAGGIFSILPVFGLWMLPLGFALMSDDIPRLKVPLEKTARGVERLWARARGVRKAG